MLSHIGSSDPSISWTAKTRVLALTSLKILARERVGIDELISQEGLSVIAKLAELSSSDDHNTGNYESEEEVKGKCSMYMHVHCMYITCTI